MRSNSLLAVSLSLISLSAVSADHYVDSSRGSDSAAGTSPAEAWKTLARTRKGGIKPGDTVRLACGGIWREQLVPVSGLKGKPVTYASYDPPGTKGLPPPAIQSSLDRSKPSDWKSVGEGLWATAEFSFEYWHAGETRDILFEGNICRDAGFGWGHDQRPDRNGAHILFYENKAATTNFVIRNNQFIAARDWTVRMENDWREGLTIQGSKIISKPNVPVIRWLTGMHEAFFDIDGFKALGFD